MNKEISITKVLANKLDHDLDVFVSWIEKTGKGYPKSEQDKLVHLKDVITRAKEDLWRNCISNPMV